MSLALSCTTIVMLGLGSALFPVATQSLSPEVAADALIARVIEARQVRGARGTARLIHEDIARGTSKSHRLTITSATRDRVTTVLYQARSSTAAAASALLLTFSPGRAATGYFFNGPDFVRPLTPALLEQPFLATDLLIADLTDDFLAWPSQRQIGSGKLLGRDCTIIESRPSASNQSPIVRVRSWIARSIALPLKIEKFGADGSLLRQFLVERVARLDDRHWSASVLTVIGTEAHSRTKLKIVRGDRCAEVRPREFEVETIRQLLLSKPAAAVPKARGPQ